MRIYFAQFMPAEDKPGAYCVDFPDLEGCFTEGDTLAEALSNAQECLTSYLGACVIQGEDLPEASPLKEAQKKAEAEGASIPEGTFYQAVQAAPLNEKPIQVSISMLPSLVSTVDNAAKRAGMTRSGFLAAAARAYCGQTSA